MNAELEKKLKKIADSELTISETVDLAYGMAKSKGFHDNPRSKGETLMLIVSELSEALEADRKGRVADRYLFEKRTRNNGFVMVFEKQIKDSFEDELADALIRICDLAGSEGIDLGWHVRMKMMYNSSRERLHGKKY